MGEQSTESALDAEAFPLPTTLFTAGSKALYMKVWLSQNKMVLSPLN
jgi:hypothetical protein